MASASRGTVERFEGLGRLFPRSNRILARLRHAFIVILVYASIAPVLGSIAPRSLDYEYANVQDSLERWNQSLEQRTNFFPGLPSDLWATSPEVSFQSIKRLAELGDGNYESLLGLAYSYGWGVNPDKREALRWLRKGTEKNIAPAQTGLGELLITGAAGETNKAEAVRLFEKAAAKGLAEAQFQLAVCYHFGHGTGIDFNEARRLYESADRQNYPPATCNLAGLYDRGQGVERDFVKSLELYRRAAAQGYAMAIHAVGVSYARAEGVPQDFSEAAKWYRRAAVLGYPPAQHNLGNALMNGRGVIRAPIEAEKWFRRAAEAGILESLAAHAMLVLSGEVPGDSKAALAELQNAANRGNPFAQAVLGAIYARTSPEVRFLGLPEDYESAIWFLVPSSQAGQPVAQHALGILYASGRGVGQDKAEAFKWLTLATRAGYSNAEPDLRKLRDDITAAEMAEGLRRANAFKPTAGPNDADGEKFLPRPQ